VYTQTNDQTKLRLIGMQLPEIYKENVDVSSEGPSSGVSRASKRRSSSCIFQVVASLSSFVVIANIGTTLAQTVQDYITNDQTHTLSFLCLSLSIEGTFVSSI
jgi:hypothetical protein